MLAKVAAPLLLGSCTVLLGAWGRLPWPAVGGLVLFHASVLVAVWARRESARHWGWVSAWVSSAVVPIAVTGSGQFFTFDTYFAVLAGMNAVAALLAVACFSGGRSNSCGQLLVLAWASLAASVFLVTAYLQNWPAGFHAGLGIVLILLVGALRFMRPGRLGVQVIASLILLLVGLPVVDWVYRPTYHRGHGIELSKEYYSYEAARKDPAAFAHWWTCYLQEWDAMAGQIFERDPSGERPFRLRPNSRGRFFESTMVVNRKGLRGPELPDDKGNAYRIVALGESTTFGCTLRREDEPWPGVLERLIRERLHPQRPVQVLNAGVPAHHLRHNLARVREELLSLQPNMIISYHGINGFFLLDEALPRASGPPPPAFRPRPLRLLADCEYRGKMIHYRRRQTAGLILHTPNLADPLKTEYAGAYRELIEICRTNEIRLALANFSLAVNSESNLDVAEFYRTAAPAVHWLVRANAAHSILVKRLAEQCPEVVFVDTHPKLDGHPEMFIDLGHMTQAGRQQIAESFFSGIRAVLETDLGKP